MKKLLFTLALLIALPAFAEVKIGEPAPEFTAKDTRGNLQTIGQYKGRILVLEWTNNGCPFVKKHYGADNMQQTQRFARANDVAWLTVISSAPGKQGHVSPEEAQKIVQEQAAEPEAIILDETGVIGKAYGAKTTPHLFVIDSEGKLAYNGAIDSIPSGDEKDIEKATNYVKQAIEELQAGKPVSEPITQPYGCSVKY